MGAGVQFSALVPPLVIYQLGRGEDDGSCRLGGTLEISVLSREICGLEGARPLRRFCPEEERPESHCVSI